MLMDIKRKLGWQSLYQTNRFQIKAVIRDEEGHYTIIKGSIQQDLTIVNIYALNRGAADYISQLITKSKKHMDNNTIIVGEFNTPLTAMYRSSKQKINKETRTLNDTLDQTDFTDIFRTFQTKATEYTFFSCAHGTFSRKDHILGHKSFLYWYQKTGIIPCILWDHNALKLELNHKRKVGKNSNTWRLKSIVLKNEWVNQEIKQEF